jgi:nicotinamide-nucleotide amidase
MHAEIVMIGTELLLGEIVDTNATMMGKMLREIGLNLFYKSTVGDNLLRISRVIDLALDRSDIVITSGGLGPTVDDITRQAVADATGRELVYSLELEEQIAARFRGFGREMAENNKRQAYIPAGSLILPNPVGTAPCFLSEDSRGRGFVISLPGVPRELEYMMTHAVIPLLVERMGGAKVMKVRVLRTCAVGESNIDRGIGDLMTWTNPTVGLAAHTGQTDVRITAKADTETEAAALVAEMEATLRERLGVAIYGVEKETVPEVVGRLLAEKKIKVGLVDTLTGGQLGRDLAEAGFAEWIARELNGTSPAESWQAVGLTGFPNLNGVDGAKLAATLAQAVAPMDGAGLALLGPMPQGETHQTFIALHGPGELHLIEPGRNYQDNEYSRRWLVIQGLDWLRRGLLEQLISPVDWR